MDKRARIRGDHSWLQLRTPTGEILSIGLYRKKFAFETQEGTIHLVDPSEFYRAGGTWEETHLPVTPEQWGKTLVDILTLAKSDSLSFEQFQANCTTFVQDRLEAMGRTVDFRSHVVSFIPYSLPRKALSSPAAELVIGSIVNLGLYLFKGAGRVDRTFKKNCPDAAARLQKFSDIFQREKAQLHGPHKLRLIQLQLKADRKKEKERLIAKLETQLTQEEHGEIILILENLRAAETPLEEETQLKSFDEKRLDFCEGVALPELLATFPGNIRAARLYEPNDQKAEETS